MFKIFSNAIVVEVEQSLSRIKFWWQSFLYIVLIAFRVGNESKFNCHVVCEMIRAPISARDESGVHTRFHFLELYRRSNGMIEQSC